MAIIGYNTAGASLLTSQKVIYGRAPGAIAGTIPSIFVYMHTGGSSMGMIAGVYDDNSGAPDNLLGTSGNAQTVNESSATWVEITFDTPLVVTAQDLWLGVTNDVGSNATYHYDDGASSGNLRASNNRNDMPDPANLSGPNLDRFFSCYCDVVAGGTTLLVDDINQSQSIDQPILTQANILSTNDIDQSQSIDSPTLTQAHVLTVNDIDQTQSIDNVTLAIAGALLVNDLTQSQTVDLANIIQSHILLVNGLDQSQALDQPSLSIGITVDDLTQAQNIDQPNLIQANIVSVDNLTQAQLIDNVYSGEIVVGSHKGEVLVFSAYNGIITSTNAHTGEVKVFNAVDIT